jgi:hypothetical protein
MCQSAGDDARRGERKGTDRRNMKDMRGRSQDGKFDGMNGMNGMGTIEEERQRHGVLSS